MLNTLSNACHALSSHLVCGRDVVTNVVNNGLSYVPASVQTVVFTTLNGGVFLYQGCKAVQDIKQLWNCRDLVNFAFRKCQQQVTNGQMQQKTLDGCVDVECFKMQCVVSLRLASRVLAMAGIGTTILVCASPLALVATSVGIVASSILQTKYDYDKAAELESINESDDQQGREADAVAQDIAWTKSVTYLSKVGNYGSVVLATVNLVRVVLSV